MGYTLMSMVFYRHERTVVVRCMLHWKKANNDNIVGLL